MDLLMICPVLLIAHGSRTVIDHVRLIVLEKRYVLRIVLGARAHRLCQVAESDTMLELIVDSEGI